MHNKYSRKYIFYYCFYQVIKEFVLLIELKIIPKMKQLERLFIIYELLKTNFYSYNDIVDLLLKQNIKISKRQIQRL